MKQEYLTVYLRVEDRKNIIRRKSDGQTFGKGLCVQLKKDSPDNYEEVYIEQIEETSAGDENKKN